MHSIRKVTDDLYWVGASDKRISLFENIHPLTTIGMAYNAYVLLQDDCTVLFDCVDWAVYRQFEENIDYLLQGRNLDYVVVTHMEPDHAASLEKVMIKYPEAKVIASAKAIQMMGQFGFKAITPERTQAVKEGDVRTFGSHEITFIAAPMVHWPEVMLAFDTTNGALFSSDAFGSFKALDGALFADEVDWDRDWLDECRRYFTNIVGKYGMQTQNVIKKLEVIYKQVKFICPIHGLVWRKNIKYIVDKHNLWSRYQPEVKGVLIVYGSMYGNTESVAMALAGKLKDAGVKDVTVRDVSTTPVSWLIAESFKFSHIVFACVTYNMGIYPPMHNFLEDMHALTVQNRTCAVIYNGSWAPKAGELVVSFIEHHLKNMTILEPQLHITSSSGEEGEAELDALAEVLVTSLGE